jgi:hypothetical protein
MLVETRPYLAIPLSEEAYALLPRNPSFDYSYVKDICHIQPRAAVCRAVLNLPIATAGQMSGPYTIRPYLPAMLDPAAHLFSLAFAEVPPLLGVDAKRRLGEAYRSLRAATTGAVGPFNQEASFVVVDQAGAPQGVTLITMIPGDDLLDPASYRWRTDPTPAQLKKARPHLSWTYVRPHLCGQGLGQALLATSAAVLVRQGHTQLVSTFWPGNTASLLWHWKCGFVVVDSSRRARRSPPLPVGPTWQQLGEPRWRLGR